ncbi:RNA polymerase factor sigma-54 [Bacillus benzoevorans]|uniref:RNA polymerase sigma-54 factor n=1 Tax=Bacillus benzoevorans TaxID=1456 RepID=A0A7X0HQM4_9BACI|nr:RNA polymerase factor sigma-54 [Bacillus benzoevorans]MBB6445083.1 RNA polymerase sigma-54 factor [Bacillus benzoevorans]
MDLRPGLRQQQTIKLSMTQELTQAITLLQYSTQELSEFLENKAIENPLLQIEAGNIKTIDPRYDRVKKVKSSTQADRQSWLEQMAKNETSLVSYLMSQIDLGQYNHEMKRILNFLINSLDANGYLPMGHDECAHILEVPHERVEKAVALIQGLEPAGIGARNLQECLLLQLERKEKKNHLAESIISDYFVLFAEKKWKLVAKHLNVELKEIQNVFDYVQSLNPRPASDFSSEQTAYIIPDITIKWDGNSFSVSIFDEVLPKIEFNQSYYEKFNRFQDKQVQQFLKEKHHDYHWIARSIEQRKETIHKVALKIVEKQPDFFIYGPEKLKPMTMKEISEELGIHESTVSRAVREKYAQTPFGTFELKSFFSSAIKTASNEDTGSQEVKKWMTKLIDEEDKYQPLSDQELVRLLEGKKGIIVSRRTIAKYRDQLGIPSSSKRKRFG